MILTPNTAVSSGQTQLHLSRYAPGEIVLHLASGTEQVVHSILPAGVIIYDPQSGSTLLVSIGEIEQNGLIPLNRWSQVYLPAITVVPVRSVDRQDAL
jgi:hypothetical protein